MAGEKLCLFIQILINYLFINRMHTIHFFFNSNYILTVK